MIIIKMMLSLKMTLPQIRYSVERGTFDFAQDFMPQIRSYTERDYTQLKK